MKTMISSSVDEMIIRKAAKDAVPICPGVRVFSDHQREVWCLSVKGSIVPMEWASAAFQLLATRHDVGYGDESFMYWLFPLAASRQMIQHMPILIQDMEQQMGKPQTTSLSARAAAALSSWVSLASTDRSGAMATQ